MTRKQIEKHKETIHWFIDNPDKGVWFKDCITRGNPKWEHTNAPTFSSSMPHVQNDEYAELRKAQADGKVIQVLNERNGEWYDEIPLFQAVNKYRIKPDAPTWICDQCKEEQTSSTGCSSKYTDGSYCSSYCADMADLSKMLRDKR